MSRRFSAPTSAPFSFVSGALWRTVGCFLQRAYRAAGLSTQMPAVGLEVGCALRTLNKGRCFFAMPVEVNLVECWALGCDRAGWPTRVALTEVRQFVVGLGSGTTLSFSGCGYALLALP
mmetsp:Transcript_140317/g.315058  ORF Transcript_140317/g.315058 Transcript_140317/m.315058 type:complete len:119 (+) Transcript_140317:294-650(+)